MIKKELLGLLGKEGKKQIFILTFINTLSLILNLSVIFGLTYIFNLLLLNKNIKDIYLYFLIVLLIIVVRLFLQFISAKIKSKLGNNAKVKLRKQTYNKILELGLEDKNLSSSGIMQVSIEGIEQLDIYFSDFLPKFFYSMIAPIILFIVTSFINYKVSLLMLSLTPIIPIVIVLISKVAKKIFNKYWNIYISVGTNFLDNIYGLKDLIIFKYDNIVQEELKNKSETFRKVTMKVLMMQLMSITVMDLVAFMGAALGIFLTIKLTPIDNIPYYLSLFLILIMAEFFLPLRALGSSFHVAMNGISAGQKILDIKNQKPISWGNNEIQKILSIKLSNLNFKYDNNFYLNKLSISFENKGLYSIVGKSGSGKSTISKLLIGKYNNYSGNILINDNDLFSYDRSSYYSKIYYINSNSYLFTDTIENNFKLCNITDTNLIKESLKKVKLDNFSLDFKILADSSNISGGQKQRILLAIALASNKDFYVFDEPTSNIDYESEKIIMDNIYEISKTKLVLLISHRLKNVVKSNNIYFLENGKLKESGNHDTLMNNKQNYYNIYTEQDILENSYVK